MDHNQWLGVRCLPVEHETGTYLGFGFWRDRSARRSWRLAEGRRTLAGVGARTGLSCSKHSHSLGKGSETFRAAACEVGNIQFSRDPGVHFRTAPVQTQLRQQFSHVLFGVG